jgi:hypothetical protein
MRELKNVEGNSGIDSGSGDGATENSLIPPLPLEVVTEELPIVQETDLIQPSTASPDSRNKTEPLEESVEESLEETIPNRVRRFIAI